MSQIQWRGYPVAQHQGDVVAEYRGHTIEIARDRWLWWHPTIDDNVMFSAFNRLIEAKQACIDHINELEDKKNEEV